MAENTRRVSLRKTSQQPEGMPKFNTRTVEAPGLKGTLPFQAADVLNRDDDAASSPEVARGTKAILDAPIPAPAVRSIRPPKPVDFSTLPEEKQNELIAAIRQSAERPRSPASRPVQRSVAPPPQEEEVYDEPEPPPPPPVQRRRPAPPPPPAQVEEQEQPQEEEPQAESTTGTTVKTLNCVHCGWPVDKTDNTNPSTFDKQAFVASILGQKRFFKTYDLMGSRVRVTFRSLTTEENDTVIKQLIIDWNDGKISGPAHSVAEATKYQMALGLHSIETSVGVLSIPMMSDYDYDPTELGKNTVLPSVVQYVNDTIVNETLRRVINKAYGHFIDTLSKLEAMAENPDFWETTEGQA